MSRRNPYAGIQIVCVVIIILSVIGSVFVGSALKSANQKTDEYNAAIKACENGQAANAAGIDALKAEKEITKARYDTVAEDLEYAKNGNHTKQNGYVTSRLTTALRNTQTRFLIFSIPTVSKAHSL